MTNEYPVLEVVTELKAALAGNPAVILQAPPGAGKSTVLPLKLLNETWLEGKKIIMLEPRRLATRSVANRLASQLAEEVGNTIGYRIRFETKVSSKTRIEIVTEGILTRMIQCDNTLEDVGLVIFDEFHERSLQADLSLALSLQVQQVLRPDLRILIMSATLDGEKLSAILGNAPAITSHGKQYPVDLRYVNIDSDAPTAIRMSKAIRKALREEQGDILAFLPGAGEIARTQQLLEEANTGAAIYSLYGDLAMKKQQEAIMPDPSGGRKIVLATSIAETSLTIEGIRVVIDSGLSRVPRFDPVSGLTRLETIRVTKDAADQRAGRAGRLGPGICYRLWPEAVQMHLVAHRNPEILDADLASLCLELSQWGERDLFALKWITPPPRGAVSQAKELLQQLGAVDDKQITTRGRDILKLPTHPRLAHMLMEAKDQDQNSLSVAIDVASILEERDPLEREAGADISLRLEALRKWRAGGRVIADTITLERIEKLASSWRRYFKTGVENSVVADEKVGELVALAYPERIAKQESKNSERYKLANGRVVKLPQHDPLMREPWLSIAHLDAGKNEGKIFLAAPLNERDFEHLAIEQEVVRWDRERRLIVGAREKRVGSLVLSSKPLQSVDAEKRISVLIDAIREEGLSMIGWGDEQKLWQARVMSVKGWRPNEDWPDVSDEALLHSLETWLSPYLQNATKQADLHRLDLNVILQGVLPWNLQNRLNELAPTRIEVPSGSMIKVNYFSDGRSPVMEVRLQEVFGLLDTPAVNEGRTKVLLHLLSPGFKPVQVTQDLKSFWQTTYHEVRKELRVRYPKHSWPENPWTAQAVRGTRRRG